MGPQLADLIAEGKVQWEIRHFPLRPQSVWGVEATECAGEQGYWWAMHHEIFANQAKGLSTKLTKEYARTLGLDTRAFDQCVDDDRYVAYAKEREAEAVRAGLAGTPFFLVNNKPLGDYRQVVDAVKKELNQQ